MSSHVEKDPVHEIEMFVTGLKEMFIKRATDPKYAETDFFIITKNFRLESNLSRLVRELTPFQWSTLKQYMQLFIKNPGLNQDQREIIQACMSGLDRIVSNVVSKKPSQKSPRAKQKKFIG